jgi:predicted permease
VISLRDAARSLLHDRRFTAVAIGLLAVTIGAVTAIYAVVQAVVLHPLPFADQDRTVVVWQRDDRRALPVIEVSYGEIDDWRERTRTFSDLAVVGSVNWSLAIVEPAGATTNVQIAAVSASFFPIVGTMPASGRGLVPADEDGPLPRAVVISHGLWTRRFGRDPSIVRKTVSIKLDNDGPAAPVEIVGVMPEAFDYPRGAELWAPAAPLIRKYSAGFGGPDRALRVLRVFYGLGRVAPGVRVETAARELASVMRATPIAPGVEPSAELVVTPIARHLLGPAAPVLWILLAGAAMMLAIACANVAGLQISRAARRQRALAIRIALGASHARLIWHSVLESGLVTAVALAGAAVVAYAITGTLVALAPPGVPRLDRVTLFDLRVVAWAAAAAFVTLMLCGLWPALAARRLDALSVLAHSGSASGDRRSRRVQRAIIVAQIAVALTLLAGAALFVRTLDSLNRTALGFDPNRLIAIDVTPATDNLDRWNTYYEALVARVAALPDVIDAGAVALRPLSGPVGVDSQPIFPGQDPKQHGTWTLNAHTNLEVVSPGYFRTMGIRLVRGRLLSPQDTITSSGAVVISETTARRLWPGEDAVGKQLRDPSYRTPAGTPPGWQTVVGVVEDVRYRGLNDVRLDLYLPAAQTSGRLQQLMVRTRGNPSSAVASVVAAARAIDANVTIGATSIMTDVVAVESAPWRFLMRVFSSFAALAVLLAAIGLGAVIAIAVSARRPELAIRAALGATRARLRAVVLNEGLALLAMGTILGLLGAFGLGRAVGHLLVGVAPYDPLALAGATCLASVIGVIAMWIPARRATRVQPIEALRAE